MKKYLRLNNLSSEKLDEVRENLAKTGVSFDEFDYSTDAFLEEEAEFRLEIWENLNYKIDNENLRSEILSDLEDSFFDSEYIINGDVLEDLTNECLETYENELNKIG